MHKYRPIVFICVLFFLFGPGCEEAKNPPPPTEESSGLLRATPSEYPVFEDDRLYDGLAYGIQQSLSYLQRIPSDRPFVFGKDRFDTAHLIKSLEFFSKFVQSKPSKNNLKNFIESNYLVYRVHSGGNAPPVLFTGYYEPMLKGSLTKTDEYRFPLYSRPDDLITIDLSQFSPRFKGETLIGRYTGRTIVPYYDRKEIQQTAAFRDRARPIAWVKDPIDLFFLHIQGSGKIFLDNGETVNVHCDITNGRPYRSIGKILMETGKIDGSRMSMETIRAYLRDNPQKTDDILNYNPRYVFFKKEKNGPFGCLGVPLTPGRSLALDRRIFPPASLAFIETKKPVVNGKARACGWTDLSRFVLNQDTGGAIQGAGRADLFWGSGTEAEISAGMMQQTGNLYFLILKPDTI
jgi:membrane-bound lytic murein transglycosylase A